MEKVGEDTIEEANNSIEETSEKEDESIRGIIADRVDPVDSTGKGSTGPSNSHTIVSKDHDFSESDMEDEEQVLEFFRRSSGLLPEVAKRNNFPYLNNSEGMVLQIQEDTPAETEQTNVMFHSLNDSNEIADLSAVNLNSPDILEGIKSSSASDEDTEDSSSNSDLDSSLSRYYFDGSLPVSAHVEEFETHQDESHVPKDENQMPLLCLKQPVLQPTSWRNCCGLLELLWAADP
ncbi:hypothetical protein ISN45_Aa04g028610 [Arabidopsis thaliana x Arabidopsis arenosa]|uniref:Uncharacterized protein n=1 Tax=Arabidopsis thaliana x Arabidopsis arenosa TaxID=1240361 RepID=A0A8T2ADT3_9BRAS|nr:hypothetical protein ISN45_Aa04g028610 [Arabidopsis thaliana x Arabidopsis arenosa]